MKLQTACQMPERSGAKMFQRQNVSATKYRRQNVQAPKRRCQNVLAPKRRRQNVGAKPSTSKRGIPPTRGPFSSLSLCLS